jgi:hypothetical protein
MSESSIKVSLNSPCLTSFADLYQIVTSTSSPMTTSTIRTSLDRCSRTGSVNFLMRSSPRQFNSAFSKSARAPKAHLRC